MKESRSQNISGETLTFCHDASATVMKKFQNWISSSSSRKEIETNMGNKAHKLHDPYTEIWLLHGNRINIEVNYNIDYNPFHGNQNNMKINKRQTPNKRDTTLAKRSAKFHVQLGSGIKYPLQFLKFSISAASSYSL